MFNFQYSINGTIDFRGRWVKAETLHKILVQQGGLAGKTGCDLECVLLSLNLQP